MSNPESLCNLYDYSGSFPEIDRAFLDFSVEGCALVGRHDEKQLAIGRFTDFINRADVGMIEGRCSAGFVKKPVLFEPVVGDVRSQKLEGNAAVKPGVVGPEDNAHPAFTQFLKNPVMGYGLAQHHLYPRFTYDALAGQDRFDASLQHKVTNIKTNNVGIGPNYDVCMDEIAARILRARNGSCHPYHT